MLKVTVHMFFCICHNVSVIRSLHTCEKQGLVVRMILECLKTHFGKLKCHRYKKHIIALFEKLIPHILVNKSVSVTIYLLENQPTTTPSKSRSIQSLLRLYYMHRNF
jgi:hypothetical protein